LEEVIVHPGHEALMAVVNNSALIVGDAQGILGQQLWPRQIHLLIISISITVLITYLVM
jgi:hypothetical protein